MNQCHSHARQAISLDTLNTTVLSQIGTCFDQKTNPLFPLYILTVSIWQKS